MASGSLYVSSGQWILNNFIWHTSKITRSISAPLWLFYILSMRCNIWFAFIPSPSVFQSTAISFSLSRLFLSCSWFSWYFFALSAFHFTILRSASHMPSLSNQHLYYYTYILFISSCQLDLILILRILDSIPYMLCIQINDGIIITIIINIIYPYSRASLSFF